MENYELKVFKGKAKIEISNVGMYRAGFIIMPTICLYYFNPTDHFMKYRYGIAVGFACYTLGFVFYRNWKL